MWLLGNSLQQYVVSILRDVVTRIYDVMERLCWVEIWTSLEVRDVFIE